MERLGDLGSAIKVIQFNDNQTLHDICPDLLHQIHGCLHGACETEKEEKDVCTQYI